MRSSRAIIPEKAAILQPNDFATAEEWKGLQPFTKACQCLQGFPAVGDLRVDDFVVHAAQFSGPLLEHLAAALLYGKFVIAVDEEYRRNRGSRGRH